MSAPLALRPMEFGDILDGAFKLYRAEFTRLAGAALLASLPALLFDVASALTLPSGDPFAHPVATLLRLGGRLVVAALTSVLVYATLTHQADRALRGEALSAGRAVLGGARRYLPLLGAYALSMTGVMLGLVLFVVPGILLGLLWFAVAPAVVLEGRGPVAALGRSRQLARGALGHLAGVLIVAAVITLLPSLAASALGALVLGAGMATGAAPAGGLLAVNAVQVLLSALVSPFSAAVVLLLYYDRRIRVEAFDVQLAAEALGAEPHPVAP